MFIGKQVQFLTQIVAFFLIYVNKSTKSRVNRYDGVRNTVRDYGRSSISRSSVGCPIIPTCQWSRFEELPIKMKQGSRSSVSMLVDNYSQEPVVKKIFTDKSDFISEMKALSCIRIGHNPWLVYPVCADPLRMIMVLEWCGDGDLTKWNIFDDGLQPYSYEDMIEISAQMVAAVAATHRRGFIHGDLKPENFVINTVEKRIKLIDFGLSEKIGDFRIMAQGTPQTMAPEVAFTDFFDYRIHAIDPKSLMYREDAEIKFRPQFIREAMDWWSLGVTLHYIFAKFFEEQYIPSSEDENSTDFDDKSSKSDDRYFPYKTILSEKDDEILDFRYRPTPPAFPRELRSLLDKLMTWRPENRNFSRRRLFEEICRHEFFEDIDWDQIDSNLLKF